MVSRRIDKKMVQLLLGSRECKLGLSFFFILLFPALGNAQTFCQNATQIPANRPVTFLICTQSSDTVAKTRIDLDDKPIWEGEAVISSVQGAQVEYIAGPVTIAPGNYVLKAYLGNYNSTTGALQWSPSLTVNISVTSDPIPPPYTCTYTLSGPSTIGSEGGTGNLVVTATDQRCGWTLTSNAPWFTLQTLSGTGTNNYVQFTATPNIVNQAQSATILIPGTNVTFTVTQAPAVPPSVPPCEVGMPIVNILSYTNRFKVNAYGTVKFQITWNDDVTPRRSLVWIETQLSSQVAQRITDPQIIQTLVSMNYKSLVKGVFNLVVRAQDSAGCIGDSSLIARQVRVN